jgi:exodeoxyribonuclease V alpha subunit
LNVHTPEAIEGVIESVVYHSEDTGYTVLRVSVPGMVQMLNAVGPFTSPVVGETVRLHGEWTKHPKFGMQFRFDRYETLRPATVQGIEKYLGSGLVRGIGPVMAKRLVRHFGEKTLDVLDSAPERVREVDGIGPKRADRLAEAWREQKAIQNVMLFLQSHGVSASYAVRIYRVYGDAAIRVLEENPFRLARDIWGIGFKTADRIARSLGIEQNAPARLEAGLEHVLHQATDDGHVFLPRQWLLQKATEVLEVSQDDVEQALEGCLRKKERLDVEVDAEGVEGVFLSHMLWTEREVAGRLKSLMGVSPTRAPTPRQTLAWLGRTRGKRGVELSEQQTQAVIDALRQPVLVITGGPGTGKTTVTRTIVEACDALGKHLALASPTGRAAKRLAEVTGRPAKTIHRLLVVDPKTFRFKHGPDNLLDIDFLIVDEASMLEVALARDLLRALPDACQLVLVGDADQLPAVGPGNVLGDIIRSGAVPVCRLTEVFRQAAQSMIVRSAHRIHRGQFPVTVPEAKHRGQNCVFIEEDEVENIVGRVVRLVTQTLPRQGFEPQDVQVIAPLHRGAAGVSKLNDVLQETLNPRQQGRFEVRRGGRMLRVGDRVLQLVNDYDKNVFNGDIGVVSGLDLKEQLLRVAFPESLVLYDFSEIDQLQLAYAMTVHKSQGSEYEAVVLVLHRSQYVMLQRNLLYTGLTRARKMLVIVGDRRGLWAAVRNDRQARRWSRLAARIAGRLPDDRPQAELAF